MSFALVTGSAKGIGKAIANELAKKDYRLLLVDIDIENLKKTALSLENEYGITVLVLEQDLSEPAAADKIFQWALPFSSELTVVVNDAGFGLNGSFEKLSLKEQFEIIDVNIKAQLAITYAFIPILKTKQQSYLLNVASTTAYQSVPYLNVYAASKAFVLSFNRSLYHELKNTPVSLSILSPGPTDTDFVIRARMHEGVLRLAKRFNMTPQQVAKIAIDGLFAGKTEIIPGFINKLNAFLPKFFPKKFVEKIAANIYKQKEQLSPAAIPPSTFL